MEIFVIREGQVVSFLQEAYVNQHLPVLPPEVHIVKLTWQATDDIVSTSYFLTSMLNQLFQVCKQA